MVRPGRDRLRGVVEVDETYWGGEDPGLRGRQIGTQALIAVAAETEGRGIGRIRLRHIADTQRPTLHHFIAQAIEPGSTVHTDGLKPYTQMRGYVHQRHGPPRPPVGAPHLLPRVHRVVWLLKRWLLGTHQGAVAHAYLDDYLNKFTFRFNRRTSASRGQLF